MGTADRGWACPGVGDANTCEGQPCSRSAIDLTALRGFTQSEAAKHAGVSVSGMKSRVQRAREQLKKMLLRCCEVEVDRRGAIAGYQVRETSPCIGAGSRTPAARRCAPGTCAPGS